MAKNKEAAHFKKQCCGRSSCKCWGWMFLVIGILLLLKDLGYWTFWNLEAWTLVFLALGVWKLSEGYKR